MYELTADEFDPSKPLVTEGYVCNEKDADLKLQQVTLPPLSPTMVQVQITHVGLCHTDIHMQKNDWGTTDYPILLGHEGVGTVTHIGDAVHTLKPGMRVGISWIRDSCKHCRNCLKGRENICEEGYQGTYLGKSSGIWGKGDRWNEHGGCYSRVQRIEERFTVQIPDSLPTNLVCPLLCGGATLYEPIVNHCGIGKRVGIMGLGGLGRSGVKLAKLRGCHVTVISTSPHKRQAALECGADAFYTKEEFSAQAGSLDVILDTRPENPDALQGALSLLKFEGHYVRVGIPPANKQTFESMWLPLIFQQQSISGSTVTGSARLNELLHLCGENAEFIGKGEDKYGVEVVPMDTVNEHLHKLKNGENKGYRYILEW